MPDLYCNLSISEQWEINEKVIERILLHYVDGSLAEPLPSNKEEAMQVIKAAGFRLIRLGPNPGWSRLTESEEISDRDSYAIVLEKGFIAVLIRPLDFLPHDDVISRFMEDAGITSENRLHTFIWRIDQGTLAILFKVPVPRMREGYQELPSDFLLKCAHERIERRVERYPGFEFLHMGSYVEGPYSDTNSDLLESVIECGSPAMVQEAPIDLMNWNQGGEFYV